MLRIVFTGLWESVRGTFHAKILMNLNKITKNNYQIIIISRLFLNFFNGNYKNEATLNCCKIMETMI